MSRPLSYPTLTAVFGKLSFEKRCILSTLPIFKTLQSKLGFRLRSVILLSHSGSCFLTCKSYYIKFDEMKISMEALSERTTQVEWVQETILKTFTVDGAIEDVAKKLIAFYLDRPMTHVHRLSSDCCGSPEFATWRNAISVDVIDSVQGKNLAALFEKVRVKKVCEVRTEYSMENLEILLKAAPHFVPGLQIVFKWMEEYNPDSAPKFKVLEDVKRILTSSEDIIEEEGMVDAFDFKKGFFEVMGKRIRWTKLEDVDVIIQDCFQFGFWRFKVLVVNK